MVDDFLGEKKVETKGLPEHRDIKAEIKGIIDEKGQTTVHKHFSREELVGWAGEKGISEDDALAVVDDLLKEGWLHERDEHGGLLTREAWDYSPAFEDLPDW